jgi:hypothetical protein
VRDRQVVPYLVAVSPTISLSYDIAPLNQLREDPMSRPLCDPHRIGDIAHSDAQIVGDAQQNMGVVGEEVPVGRYG